MPSRSPNRRRPNARPKRRLLDGVDFIPGLDLFSRGLEYGLAGLAVGVTISLLIGLIWGLIAALGVGFGLRRVRRRP